MDRLPGESRGVGFYLSELKDAPLVCCSVDYFASGGQK